MQIKTFQFSYFMQNTMVLYDETREAVIIDPGCYTNGEKKILADFIYENKLTLKSILLTHCHLDHVFGTNFLAATFPGVSVECHEHDKFFNDNYKQFAAVYSLKMDEPALITHELDEGHVVTFGNTSLVCIHVPGHSPGSLCFYNEHHKLLITGDVLFAGSIGRSDLPGGNHEQLVSGIKQKLFTLPDDTMVFPGHGVTSTIGKEKRTNPFFK
jgi:glyoxylase-like metal-dependent hydrolase (beta-lactamase superfamily II)